MLVFSVLALAQLGSSVHTELISAPSMSQLDLSPSTVTIPPPPQRQPLSNTTSTLFDFFPSSSAEMFAPSEWGDSIHQHPGDLHRIYFQNIDGLRNDVDEISLYVSSMAHPQRRDILLG